MKVARNKCCSKIQLETQTQPETTVDISQRHWWLSRKIASSNQKHYPDLGSNTLSVWNMISALVSSTSFCGETTDGVARFRLFSQTNVEPVFCPIVLWKIIKPSAQKVVAVAYERFDCRIFF